MEDEIGKNVKCPECGEYFSRGSGSDICESCIADSDLIEDNYIKEYDEEHAIDDDDFFDDDYDHSTEEDDLRAAGILP